MNLKSMDNLVIEIENLRLRELLDSDHDRIVEIIRACSVRATLHLYDAYKQKMNLKGVMLSTREREFFERLLGCFKLFDENFAQRNININNYKKILNEIEGILKQYPDEALFAPYGPIQAPFDGHVTEFINDAKITRNADKREMFRMGIEVDSRLIGCFTFDFIKCKTPNYPGETTLDPGIFIEPGSRKKKDKKTPWWPVVFSIAAVFVERFYPFNNEEVFISATTHRLNRETGNILNSEKGFKEFKESFVEKAYGERRFFTISRENFIKNFRMEGDSRIKTCNIIHDK